MSNLPKDVAIRIDNVHKDFFLPHHKSNSLKQKIVNVFKEKEKGGETQHALRGVSFDIKKGEFFGILGRNGSGKSTLLKIISEIYTPTKGKVTKRGRLVPFIELGVGFNPELSGRENVFLNGALLGFSRSEIEAMYDEIVEFAELEKFMDQKLKNYSSGMQVRLAFSVAIRADADILILDEVLAVGDADFQRKCYDYFKSLKERKKTIVFVTHSMGAVREYCDKAILIQDGKIAHTGTADEIADEYLRMFNKPSNDAQRNKRWGNGQVNIKNLNITVKPRNINIHFELISSKSIVEDVVLGFRIKDSQGRVIAGANNLNVEGSQKMSFNAGEEKMLDFDMPNIFGNETYSVGATVRLSDGVTICDSWEDAKTFSNTKDDVYYPVVCPAKLTIASSQ